MRGGFLRGIHDGEYRVGRPAGAGHITADEGYMSVRVAERDVRACRDLLEGFKLHLLGLEEQYPQNIQVSYLEV